MIRPDTSLWDFSLSFYQHPKVEALCLELQDKRKINVNCLLWALWLDNIRQITDFSIWQKATTKAGRWHFMVVSPIRFVRRKLSKDGLFRSCRAQLLHWELWAEKRELNMLERLTPDVWAKRVKISESKLFVGYLMADFLEEQQRLMTLFEQWLAVHSNALSTDEKKPLD